MSFDNKPTIGPYTKLTPFRFWCQKVIPLVYDESLSYYELLCKVIDYLNKTMEDVDQAVTDVTELSQAFNSLVDFVNQSFDELNLQNEVNNKIDAMIEDGTFIEFFKNVLPFVTPEMFGAYGDGEHDDTEAVQAAFDSGRNICLPIASQYLVTDTIEIKNITRSGMTCFSEAVTRYRTKCRIICSFADATHPVFKVKDDGFTFENISINARNLYDNGVNLTVFDCDTGAADVDLSLINCAGFLARTVVKINGRGLSIQNCAFASCSRLLHINWPGESTTPWHNDATGHRAFVIENNRFHSFSRESVSFIYVESGNVFGMRFVGNNFDRGYTSFLLAETALKDWLVENNTFHGMGGVDSNDSFMCMKNGCDGLVFNGNTFVNGIESSYHFTNVLEFRNGDVKNIVVTNNNFGVIYNGSIIINYSTTNTDGMIISNNMIEEMKELSTQRAVLYLSSGAPAKSVSIIGNVIRKITPAPDTTNDGWMLRASGGYNMSYCKIMGNVIYDHMDRQISTSGTDNSDHCVYDWT